MILTYLDRTLKLGLLPEDLVLQTEVTAPAHALAVDVHPVCNLSVMMHATGGQEPARTDWMYHFIRPSLSTFEALISEFDQASFTYGDTPGLADICLIPQLYNANRWGLGYSDCPRISAVEKACASHPAIKAAYPI